MIETPPDHPARRPWHLWVGGVFYLLLYSAGAYDHVMTLGGHAAYFRSQGYGEAEIAYFTDYPLLPAVFWTAGVWSALATSILLWFRTRWATPVAGSLSRPRHAWTW